MPDPRRRVLPAAAVGCSVVGRRSFCPPAVTSAGAERRPEQGRCRERCPHLPRGHRVQPDDTCTERKAAWPLCVSVPTGESRGAPLRSSRSTARLRPHARRWLAQPIQARLGRGPPFLPGGLVLPFSFGAVRLSHRLEHRQTLRPLFPPAGKPHGPVSPRGPRT